jgi:Calx-beta domain
MRGFIVSICLAVTLADCRRESASRPDASGLPTLSIGDVQTIEEQTGTPSVQFHVTLSAASELPVTVHYETEDGTAVADQDYRPASGTLIFPPHSNATQVFNVRIFVQTTTGSAKTFGATLSNAVNATVVQRRATATLKARTHLPS